MSQRQTIPPDVREVLQEILDGLQTAEPEAIEQANEKSQSDSPFAYVAGYLGATIKHQADRLERLLEKDAPPEKARTP
jgi:hypothetical protein